MKKGKIDLPLPEFTSSEKIGKIEEPLVYSNPYSHLVSPQRGNIAKYTPYLGERVPLHLGQKGLDEMLARKQGAERWFNTFTQTVFGTVLGGLVANAGYLFELPKFIRNKVKGKKYDWEGNILTAIGESIQEAVREAAPIYQTERAQIGGAKALGDPTYWASHIPSITSSIALMAVSYGGTAVLSGLKSVTSKVAKSIGGVAMKAAPVSHFVKGVGSLSQKGISALPKSKEVIKFVKDRPHLIPGIQRNIEASILSRHTYSMLESADVYKSIYDTYIDRGYSKEEAEEFAKSGANHNYSLGYWNLWKDIATWRMLFKYVDRSNIGLNLKIASKLHKTTYRGKPIVGAKAMENIAKYAPKAPSKLKMIRDVGFHGLLEGFEEYNIQWQKKEGSRKADIEAGFKDSSDSNFVGFMDRIGEHSKDPHTFDSFLFGTLGGLVFGVFGSPLIRKMDALSNRDYENIANSKIRELENISELYQLRAELIEQGEGVKADMVMIDIQTNLAKSGLQNNSIMYEIEILKNLAEHTNQELKDAGFQPDTQSTFLELAKDLENIAQKYNENSKINYGKENEKYASFIAAEKSILENKIEKYNKLKKEHEALEKESSKSRASISSDVSKLLDSHINLTFENLSNVNNKIDTIAELKNNNRVINANNKSKEFIEQRLQRVVELLKTKVDSTQKAKLQYEETRLRLELHNIEQSIKSLNERNKDLSVTLKALDKTLNLPKEADALLNEYIESLSTDILKVLSYDATLIDSKISKLKELNKSLLTKEGIKKYVDELKAQEEFSETLRKLQFEKEIGEAMTLKELNQIYEDFGKKYTEEYDNRKKQIKEREARVEEEVKTKGKINKIVDNIFNNQQLKVEELLSKEDFEFYKSNKDIIDSRVNKLKEKESKKQYQVDDFSEESSKKASEKVLKEVSDKNSQQVQDIIFDALLDEIGFNADVGIRSLLKSLLDSDYNVLPFNRDSFSDAYVAKVAEKYDNINEGLHVQYLTRINEYITSLYEAWQKGQDIGINAKSVLIKFYSEADTLLTPVISNIYNISVSNNNSLVDLIYDKESKIYASENNINSNKLENIGGILNKIYSDIIQNENSDLEISETLKNLEDSFKEWEETGDKTETKPKKDDTLDSIDLSAAQDRIQKAFNLIEQLVDLYLKHNGVKSVRGEVTILDIFNFLHDSGNTDILIRNYLTIAKMFRALEYAGAFKPNIYNKKGSRIIAKLNFNVPNFVFNDNFINVFVKELFKNENSVKEGLYAYLYNLDKVDVNNLTAEQTKTLEAFQNLKTGDKLILKVDKTHKDDRYDTPEKIEERNKDVKTVPIKISIERNGETIDLGFIQSTVGEHMGVNYINEAGEFQPFSSIFQKGDAELFLNNFTSLQNIHRKVSAENSKNLIFNINSTSYSKGVRELLNKLLNHNKSENTPITYEMVRHVLNPVFHRPIKLSQVNATLIQTRYSNHYSKFASDFRNNNIIREAINSGKEVSAKVKSSSFGVRFSKTKDLGVLDSVAPVEYQGKKEIVILSYNVFTKKGLRQELINLDTGEVVDVAETSNLSNPHVLVPRANGQFFASPVEFSYADNAYGQRVLEHILEELVQLNISEDKGKATILKNKLKYIFHSHKHNFEVNMYDTGTNRITYRFKNGNNIYELAYDAFKKEFRISDVFEKRNEQGEVILDKKNKSILSKKDIRDISRKDALELLSGVQRALRIDSDNFTFDGGNNPFVDIFGDTYDNYKDFILKTDALLSNLVPIKDENGEIVSNVYPNLENNDGPLINLQIDYSIENKKSNKKQKGKDKIDSEKIDSPIYSKRKDGGFVVPKSESDRFLGKSISEIISENEGFQYLSVINDILKHLGADIKIAKALTKVDHSNTSDDAELSVNVENLNNFLEGKSNEILINLSPYFFYYKGKGVPKGDSIKANRILHEVLHPLIAAKENKMTPEQLKSYKESLNDFMKKLDEFVNSEQGNNLLTVSERLALNKYITIGTMPGYHSEIITYAFSNESIIALLNKIDSSNKVEKTKGFWQTLLDIFGQIFQLRDNSKLSELANILQTHMEVDISTTMSETVSEKVDNKETKPKSNNPFKKGDAKHFNSIELPSIYDQKSIEIMDRYGLDKESFNRYWNELTEQEKSLEIKCL
jgi:hypothetical protein